MRRAWLFGGALLLGGAAAPYAAVPAAPAKAAESPPATAAAAPAGDAEEQIKAISADYDKQMQEFSQAYTSAKTQEERQKLFQDKYPQSSKYAPKMLAIAEANPKTPAALKALTWVIEHDQDPKGPANQALKIVARDFAADPEVKPVVQRQMWTSSPDAETLFRAVIDKNPDRDAKGMATFMLARFLGRQAEEIRTFKPNPQNAEAYASYLGKEQADKLLKQDPDAVAKQAEDLFEQVEKDYGDVKGGFNGTLGKSAATELFEMRNLAIGKTAPDITGQDVDGKPMKLSDFRGKVVTLDFWGDW